MKKPELKNSSLRQQLRPVKRKAVSLPQEELIETEDLGTGETLPLVVKPAVERVDLADWAEGNREFIQTKLFKHGAILFRGFNISTAPAFERFSLTICRELFNENGEHPEKQSAVRFIRQSFTLPIESCYGITKIPSTIVGQ